MPQKKSFFFHFASDVERIVRKYSENARVSRCSRQQWELLHAGRRARAFEA